MGHLQLTITEAKRLDEYEATIHNGLGSWMEVSRALIAIHDGNLWVGKGKNFIAYCKAEFEIGKSRVWQLIDSGKAVDEVSTVVDIPAPQSEGVAREVAKVETEQERADLWVKSNDTSPDRAPTAAHVAKTRKAMFSSAEESNGEPEEEEPEPLWRQLAAKHVEALKHLTQAKSIINSIFAEGESSAYLQPVRTQIDTDYKALRGTIFSNCPYGETGGEIRTRVQELK